MQSNEFQIKKKYKIGKSVFFLRLSEGCLGGALGCQHDFPFYV